VVRAGGHSARKPWPARADGGEATALELHPGDVGLNIRTRRAEVDGREIELTAQEFTLLETFLRHRARS
jgi:DNA-binding response OmpR family regulator